MKDFGGYNLPFVEELYLQYLRAPESVDPEWRAVFDPIREEPTRLGPSVPRRSIFNPASAVGGNGGSAATAAPTARVDDLSLQDKLDELTQAFRTYGHLEAMLDPLGRPRPTIDALNPLRYGITETDLDRPVSTASLGAQGLTVGQVLRRLRATYCRYIGVEFMHLYDPEARRWLQERMESTENRLRLTREERIKLLAKLTDAEVFEQFIRRKYLGAKSFSLEGGESLIPLLDLAIDTAAQQGVQEVVLGMAHRGRLNVLANIMQKHPREIFREFDDSDAETHPELYWGRGDVKYHLGFRSERITSSGLPMRLRLAFNPSHLEFVSAVVLGQVRARQDLLGDAERARVMPIILHGDAAFAGQGIVQETLNLSGLAGYRVGGALHVVVNNQIGFTTNPHDSRSSVYATDVALMLHAPIFHVNGEHPEAVAQAVKLAMDYRRRYRSDVFVDMYCYRRHGHNEGDEPSFTQPLMYQQIRARPTVRESYLRDLMGPEGLSQEHADDIIRERTAYLEEELSRARSDDYSRPRPRPTSKWQRFSGGPEARADEVVTSVAQDRLAELLVRTTEVPAGFRIFPRLERILGQRRRMARGERPLDWGAAEALAFATLLVDGVPVRLSGQDCGRGTFSHRHAVLVDVETEAAHVPLQHLEEGQASFEVRNSPLSEAGVLGFEYGYALENPQALVLWEAQFGDFANGAQVIIDQFITSAEDKWNLLCGLTLLLPHGFEGQGPEHSSARVERFLQLCAEDNMRVVNPTTPAQIFHLLRQQVLRSWRKPLVVFSPKSLLRHPRATSSLEELARGSFRKVLRDEGCQAPVRRVLLCSGRLYYDLLAYRDEREKKDVEIVRIEQLYPFPHDELREALATVLDGRRAADGCEVVWTQEEPRNMGAWYYVRALFGETLYGGLPLRCVARDESASPATGSAASHKREQQVLVTQAFWG
ncbi:MAG: 2-oxoglutarate dehydrogenase E1 component [Planctomycetota bacterium]|nr:MAG: 2-oxoglutarate dehydrogenase E1 component [Planctomycetota bacterium]